MSAVGSVCAQYFDIWGERLDCEWNRKCVAIPFEDMKKAALTVGVATGEGKVAAILGALRGKYLSVLIIDSQTASLVIEAEEKKAAKHAI